MWPLTLLPHHALSRLMRYATRLRFRPWKDWQIRWFIRRYGVDMGLVEPCAFPCFNAFFTRALRHGVRPIDPDPQAVVCPVDGTISAIGELLADTLLQAKGRRYSLAALFARKPEWIHRFTGGKYITLYLAPRDYHRVHMPLRALLLRSVYIPGRLFPVKPSTVLGLHDLFARNERIVSFFEGPTGPLALVMVGALFVGAMEVVWRRAPVRATSAPQDFGPEPPVQVPTVLSKGAEMGRFNMGSTVILLFPAGTVRWLPELRAGVHVVMGQRIGTLAAAST